MFLLTAALLLGMQSAPQGSAGQSPRGVRISTRRGECVVTINGRVVTFARYRELARGWTETQPEIHLQPRPDTTYECVDRMLTVLKDNGITKLGFLGNETAEPETNP